MSFGPDPWHQTQWDWRAAGNFMGGGAGSGLIVFAVLSGTRGTPLALTLLGGLALVGLGLLCVWLEIGRPLRALHVFLNPRTSWMSREACTAVLLFPSGLAAAAGVTGASWAAAALALLFLHTQSRIVRGARGIPAWREPLVAPLIVATGLAEGGGLFVLCSAVQGASAGIEAPVWWCGTLALARVLLWLAYRRAVTGRVAAGARAALDRAGRVLQVVGTVLPLASIAAALMAPAATAPLLAVAGLGTASAGAWFKYTLITRAGFNQGFALVRLPVRGVRP